MVAQQERTRPIGEVWPLLALRYGIISAGVLAWLLEADAGVAAGAILFSLMLVLELPLYRSPQDITRFVLSVAQLLLGLGAFVVRPGLTSGIILGGVVAGIGASTSWLVAASCLGVVVSVSLLLIKASVGTLLALVALYALAVAVGRLFLLRLEEAHGHHATIEELKGAQQRIAEFAETTRELAASSERQRLAEELHDTLGHALVGTLLQVQIARRMLANSPQAADARLELVESNVRDTLEQVRHALRRGTQRRGQLPLHLALESLIADFKAAGGPSVELVFLPDAERVSDVSPSIWEVLYRTTQEALTNAVRHGQAQQIRVQLEAVNRRIYLRITDDGVGADQYSPGMGLSGMVSRVQEVGGTLRFQTAPGQGFQVEVGVKSR